MRVRVATHHEAGQCDIVMITAGSRYGFGETSIQHMHRNASAIRNVVKAMTPFRSDAIVLVVSNPVDLLTSIAQELAGLPKFQVFGSGTFLESVRIRGLLAEKAGVAASSIQLFVLGVHGDGQVVAWSSATINGIPLDKVLSPDTSGHQELAKECKERAETIFTTKGATPFGTGSVVASICASILFDKREVRPVSHFQPEFDCCFSLPVVLGRKGIMKTIEMPLGSDENAAIARSAHRLKSTIELTDKK